MNGRIVVGFDGTRAAGEALQWALREAALHGSSLEVVAAWQLPVSPLGLDPAGYNDYLRGPLSDECRASTDRDVLGVRELIPEADGVAVSASIVEGDAARALVAASEGAELVVVGSRGAHGLARLLGSVSSVVVKKAKCPVVVHHAVAA